MSKLAVSPRDRSTQAETALPQPSAPRAAKIILPVWGWNYISQFLDYGLPTLLAPGNIPAVAAALPTEFVILTSTEDAEFIRGHADFRRLAAICPAAVRPIDHLITVGNHSTTLTLAYAEAMRFTGEAIVDTCFFLLASDYIMADGSLGNALARMRRGARAVTTGNFQVALEDAISWLRKASLDSPGNALSITPRELMRWGLGHLHPSTLANTINVPFSHNSHTNRLFWRIDERTVLGRFYLMHCLCVRPEVVDFVIGSSFDYSFVPELCPSGRVDVITDSDEYLVVEMQPAEHEIGLLRPGAADAAELAASLSEWTTGMHRANAHHSLIFHADDVPPETKRWTAEADTIVADIERRLKPAPMSFRDHPYWRGSVAAVERFTGRSLAESIGGSHRGLKQRLLAKAELLLTGRPPHVQPWHPLWPDYRATLRELAPFFADHNRHLLLVSSEVTALTAAFADAGERLQHLTFRSMLSQPECPASECGKFDVCLLYMTEGELRNSDRLIDRIVPRMTPGAQIIIVVPNRRIVDEHGLIYQVMVHAARFIRPGVSPIDFQRIIANTSRRAARHSIGRLRILLMSRPRIGAAVAVLAIWPLLGLSLMGNLWSLYRSRAPSRSDETVSSVLLRLRVEPRDWAEAEPGATRDRAGEDSILGAPLFNLAPADGLEICHAAAAHRA